jgi:hypothetical protein
MELQEITRAHQDWIWDIRVGVNQFKRRHALTLTHARTHAFDAVQVKSSVFVNQVQSRCESQWICVNSKLRLKRNPRKREKRPCYADSNNPERCPSRDGLVPTLIKV